MSWTLYPAAQFERHMDAWGALHAASQASPMLAPDFIHPLLREFGGGRELLAVYAAAGRPQAMALLAPSGRFGWATFQPAQAPIGLWMQESALALPALLEGLLSRLPGLGLVLGATQLDPFLLARPADGGALATLDYIDTARITLAGSFEDYWAARGKNLRTNLKKQRARLDKDGVITRMQISRDAADVAAAVADYGRLESAGWKAREGTAVHPDNAQGRFYRAMLEAFCARGAGSIYRYWFGDQLVAMDLCIEDGESIIVLKTAYDESVPGSLSPTLLMREEQMRQLFAEARIRRLEYYGKVMEWHTRWTDEVRTLYHVNHYRSPLIAHLIAKLKARRNTHIKPERP
ncbi:MAG: GNAT family N-acetyltransferase [Gammaproteobacteria bacterium]